MVGESNALLAAMVAKIDLPTARSIWCFRPEQRKLLASPAAEVLNRRLPEWLRQYSDIIVLLMVLVPILQGQVIATLIAKQSQEAQRAAAAERAREEAEKPKPAPAKPNGSGEPPKPATEESST